MYENEREQLNKLCGEAFNLHVELAELSEKVTATCRKAKMLWHELDDKLDDAIDNSG